MFNYIPFQEDKIDSFCGWLQLHDLFLNRSQLEEILYDIKILKENFSKKSDLELLTLSLLGDYCRNKEIEHSQNEKNEKILLAQKIIDDIIIKNDSSSLQSILTQFEIKSAFLEKNRLKNIIDLAKKNELPKYFGLLYASSEKFSKKFKKNVFEIIPPSYKYGNEDKYLDEKEEKKLHQPEKIECQTLYPPRKEAHTLKLYSNAYDDLSRTSGAMPDIARAIISAKSFVCISSWNNQLTKKLGMENTIGSLLLDASNRGVAVFILVWNFTGQSFKPEVGISDNRLFLLKNSPKNIFYKIADRLESGKISSFLSHHQKLVITEESAFVCGFDLTPKVVDSREHADVGGRMWHDAGARIQGIVIKDIFDMFEARWRSQPEKNMIYNTDMESRRKLDIARLSLQKIYESKEDLSVQLSEKSVQFLVSLSQSDYKSSYRQWPLKNSFSMDIMKSLMKLVKESKDHIFIANQYFIGQYQGHMDSPNTLPTALIQRIKSAYLSNEKFHVYFALPVYPGNNPESSSVEIYTRKQWKTIDFLLRNINKVTNNNAGQFITFMELGKFEKKSDNYHQVYVHSKFIFSSTDMMIGSANFNERSLAGNGDSESMLYIHGYKDEVDKFRESLIEEYFGTRVYMKLKEKDLLDKLGNPLARITIEKVLENQKNSTPQRINFEPNNERPTEDAHSTETKLKKSRSYSEFDFGSSTAHRKVIRRSSSVNKLFSNKQIIAPCAMPFGLVHKPLLVTGTVPSRIPEQSGIIISVLNQLGGHQYTR